MKTSIKFLIVLFFSTGLSANAETRPIVKATSGSEYRLYDAADSIDMLQEIADNQAEEIDSLKKVIRSISEDLPKNTEPKPGFGIWHIIQVILFALVIFLLFCLIRPNQTINLFSDWIIKKFFI